MNWMFWKSEGQTKELPGPKDIPQPVGRYLVTKKGMNSDMVWNLKAVILPRSDEKHVFDVRVYDSNIVKSKSVEVKNYHSLDDHPVLVIFAGWYNKETNAVSEKDL